MKTVGIVALIVIAVFSLSVFGFAINWIGNAGDVAAAQVDPQRILNTYEWFKDVASVADKKRADISVYKSRLDNMQESYGDVPRSSWDRTDKEQFNLWQTEVAGIVASYNSLAAEYNAAMSKINYRFANVGDLPAGASEPLPRELRAYMESF